MSDPRETTISMWYIFVSLLALAHGQQYNEINNRRDACQTKSRVIPHESYCDKYYQCIDGRNVEIDCPNGLVFIGRGRGIVNPCDYDHNVDCTDTPNRNPPLSTPHCDWLYGIFGHETSCTRYWSCWNGTATELYCVGGLLYNEQTKACDWPQFVEGCQQHPLCKDAPNGNVPLGESCERYWKCLGGYPRLQRCPAGLVFDNRALRCTNPPTELCEVPTTPPPEYIDELEEEVIGGNGNKRPAGGNRGRPIQQQRPQRPQQGGFLRGGQPQFQEDRFIEEDLNDQRRPVHSQATPLGGRPFVPEGAIPLSPAGRPLN